MPLSLDHLVIHVADLQTAVAGYRSLGFNVQIGGTHADGNTHNALVGFADGSYLELIAFLNPAPDHRWSRHHIANYEGFVDFALLPDSVGGVVHRVQAKGLNYQGPFDGGRLRPDGERLQWQIGVPPTGDLPFLCGDITPRALRVREGDVRIHPNGVQGIASLSLVVKDLAASLQRYQVLLDTDPVQTPLVISGLGLAQATVAVDTTQLILLSPLPGADTPSARQLQQLLATRGEGLLDATLRANPPTLAAATQLLPTHTTHGAPFAITLV